MSWLPASGGQCIEVSASAPGLSVSILGRFPLGLTGLISLLSEGFSRIFSCTSPIMSSVGPPEPQKESRKHLKETEQNDENTSTYFQKLLAKSSSLEMVTAEAGTQKS